MENCKSVLILLIQYWFIVSLIMVLMNVIVHVIIHGSKALLSPRLYTIKNLWILLLVIFYFE